MSLVSQLFTIVSVFGALAALAALPAWRMKRKAEASVTEIDGITLQLKTARDLAAQHKTECDRLQAETPEVFIAAHAVEIRDHNEERAMALAEGFITRQKDALTLAFRTRMDEAIGQAPTDDAAAFEATLSWAHRPARS